MLLALAVTTPAPAAELSQPRAVVELFTSQGCSSCPPADRLLDELAAGADTLALGWHVDYWDYLGWKDTFGQPGHSERQRAYAHSLGAGQVYTPQVIINGRQHVVGSRREAVLGAIEEFAGTANGLTVPIEVTSVDGTLKIRVAHTPEAIGATLWMVYLIDRREIEIKHGENAGRRIAYANIVRNIEMIGMVKDQALQTEFQLADMGRRGYDSCALILQKTTKDGTPGPIVGAALVRDLGS
ncbi:MAG: hypothetical protein BroJett030_03810 [Alphaproteobacteria bacterium]|nr:MAG: hypothetical protein BroJett030_03810 [Alphaproteobacteria bacterium]